MVSIISRFLHSLGSSVSIGIIKNLDVFFYTNILYFYTASGSNISGYLHRCNLRCLTGH